MLIVHCFLGLAPPETTNKRCAPTPCTHDARKGVLPDMYIHQGYQVTNFSVTFGDLPMCPFLRR